MMQNRERYKGIGFKMIHHALFYQFFKVPNYWVLIENTCLLVPTYKLLITSIAYLRIKNCSNYRQNILKEISSSVSIWNHFSNVMIYYFSR